MKTIIKKQYTTEDLKDMLKAEIEKTGLNVYSDKRKTLEEMIKMRESKNEILPFYTLAKNEQAVCIENFEGYSHKVFAIYVNGQYEKRIKVSK